MTAMMLLSMASMLSQMDRVQAAGKRSNRVRRDQRFWRNTRLAVLETAQDDRERSGMHDEAIKR